MTSRRGMTGPAMAVFTAILAGMALAGTDAAPAPAPSPALDRFIGLEGSWVAAEDGDMVKKGDLVAQYHLTGGGSAVVEELFPGQHHAMTTVYYMDGSDLVLTHYCMTGNQPHMRAKATKGPIVEFAFDGGSNIDPKHTKHMHSATFEFVGPNEIKTRWNEFEHGKSVMVVNIHLVRKTEAAN